MGNSLNLMRSRITATEHCRPKEMYQGRTAEDPSGFCSILILRAMSEHFCYKLNLKNGLADCQFQLRSILLCKAVIENIHRKSANEKCAGNNQFQLVAILISGFIPYCVHHEQINKKQIANDPFGNLPEDVRCTILSKLSLKEVIRTSVLSRKWKCSWTVCPKLRFDGITVCGKSMRGKQQYIQKFVDNVNAVLGQCRGTVVEELMIKIDFDSMMVEHLNNWVSFAVSSWTKSLTFDLTPEDFHSRDDYYRFPFELLDMGCISRLQKVQLSFGYIRPPTKFSGFPNLKKLDLYLVRVSGNDLEDLLSKCHNLEWLSIIRCHLNDELKVNGPLPHLLYLNVVYCKITGITLHAVKLTNFTYNGRLVSIDLNKSSKLESADISFYGVILLHVVAKLANVLMNVESLTLDTFCELQELPPLIDNPCMFSRLRFVKLMLFFGDDVDTLSLVSFMKFAPFIEKFEMHSSVSGPLYVGDEPIRRFPQHQYNYLKDLLITGFEGSKGQLEFLLYMVENAPALEILAIDRADKILKPKPRKDGEKKAEQLASIHRAARRSIQAKISPTCCIRLL